MKTHSIQVSRTAHYAMLGEAGKEVKYLWIACHGYGQLARRFIRKLEVLEAPDTLVLAPEGLSRFYWGGFSGKVVASWMTREDRLDEIADYCNFLSALHDLYVPQLHPDVKIVLMGFSQGVATQLRWILQRFPRFHELVCWAGTVPEDLDYRPHSGFFAGHQLHYVYGTQDEFITPERIEEQRALMKKQELQFKTRTFSGPHDLHTPTLQALAEEIRRRHP